MIVRLATHAMGTRFEFVLSGEDEMHLRAAGEGAIEIIEEWHGRLNYFAPDSLVSHINAHAADRTVRLDGETFELLKECETVWRSSGGAFDITVAPLMHAWGFREGRMDGECAGMGFVDLEPWARTIRFRRKGVRIDLGGIAKGHALDGAARLLREEGIECALLHGGTSSVIAIGAPPREITEINGWRIQIGTGDTAHAVELRDTALGVSSPSGRMIDHDGKPRGHVMDPRKNAPAVDVKFAAVVCESARLADAWSTALVAGAAGQATGATAAGVNSLMVGADGSVIQRGVGDVFGEVGNSVERKIA